MTLSLSAPFYVGDNKIVVLSQVFVETQGRNGSSSLIAAKRPLFVLIAKAGNEAAFDISGRRVPVEMISALHPSAWDLLQ